MIFIVGSLAVMAIYILFLMNFAEDQKRSGAWVQRVESFVGKFKSDEEIDEKEALRMENAEDFQVTQSKIAIAGGGIIGKGPGRSTQRNFLPHPYSDFVYALIIEEYGLLGGVVVMLLYLILLFRAVMILVAIPQSFGGFLAFGLASIISYIAFGQLFL